MVLCLFSLHFKQCVTSRWVLSARPGFCMAVCVNITLCVCVGVVDIPRTIEYRAIFVLVLANRRCRSLGIRGRFSVVVLATHQTGAQTHKYIHTHKHTQTQTHAYTLATLYKESASFNYHLSKLRWFICIHIHINM